MNRPYEKLPPEEIERRLSIFNRLYGSSLNWDDIAEQAGLQRERDIRRVLKELEEKKQEPSHES